MRFIGETLRRAHYHSWVELSSVSIGPFSSLPEAVSRRGVDEEWKEKEGEREEGTDEL